MQGKSSAGALVAIAVVLTILISTNVWNPFPGIWDWISTSGPIADPPAYWQQRLGGSPKSVTLVDDYVVIEQPESVEVRSRSSGARLWRADADWTAVAGPSGSTVIVTGELLSKGYRVLSLSTGTPLHGDDHAAAVWTFSDALLDIACRTARDCALTAREPATAEELWRVPLPGYGFVLFADNPQLPGSTPVEADQILARADPLPMPPLLGFPVEGRVHVIDTADGRALPVVEPARQDMVVVAGGRVLRSQARSSNAGCSTDLIGTDAVTGGEVWHRPSYQLRTISGAGCEQRKQPVGTSSALIAVRPDGREVLLGARDGRELLVCGDGEHIAAVDAVNAVVRSKDGTKITSYSLGRSKPRWSRKISAEASVSVLHTIVVLAERGPDRVIALDAATGQVRVEVRSAAQVVAVDQAGLLLNERRELAYIPLPSPARPGSSTAPEGSALH